MTTLKGIYDSMNKRLMIEFSCSLLKDHYETFAGTVKKSGLHNIELQKVEDSRCLIIIPMDLPGSETLGNGERISPGLIPNNILEKVSSAIDDFRCIATKKELETTEFIPLAGYPIESLKKDIIEAIKNKRNFCLIDKYSNYKKFSNHEITKILQYKVEYLSDDYSNIALDIYEGNLKGLKEQYLPKLEEVDWE